MVDIQDRRLPLMMLGGLLLKFILASDACGHKMMKQFFVLGIKQHYLFCCFLKNKPENRLSLL